MKTEFDRFRYATGKMRWADMEEGLTCVRVDPHDYDFTFQGLQRAIYRHNLTKFCKVKLKTKKDRDKIIIYAEMNE